MHTVSSRPETAKVDRKTQNRKKINLLFRALTRELIPAAVFLDAQVSSRPETAKVDRKTQNRKKINLLFRALTRELIPAAVFLDAHS